MALDLVQIRELAERKEDENSRFRQFLKTRCNLEPNEIDRRVFETARRVWAGTDCTTSRRKQGTTKNDGGKHLTAR
jgi:hypothetical protein